MKKSKLYIGQIMRIMIVGILITNSCEDNIIAGHFIKNSDGTHWKSSALSYIASRRNDINKALSHLTYARVKNKPSWHIKHIMQDIESAYGEFLALLPEREYSKWQA